MAAPRAPITPARLATLHGGHVVALRLAHPDELPAIRAALTGRAGELAERRHQPGDGAGVVATARKGAIVGHGAFLRLFGARAEVAVDVRPEWRRLGLARLLLAELEALAVVRGFTRLVAIVDPDDTPTLGLLRSGRRTIEEVVPEGLQVEVQVRPDALPAGGHGVDRPASLDA